MAKTNVQKTVKVEKTVKPIPIVQISTDELYKMLAEESGSNIVTLTTKTDARLKKTNNPFGMVWKHTKLNCFIGISYENCVNNQLDREEKETEFEAMPAGWGEYVPGTCLVEHKGNKYLPILAKAVVGDIVYRDDNGKVLTKEQVAPWLPSRSKGSRQGTDKEVVWRKYKMESIIGIMTNGTYYHIIF